MDAGRDPFWLKRVEERQPAELKWKSKENEKNRKKEIDISGKAVIMDMFAERGTESNRTHVLFLFPHIFVSAAQQGRGSAS